MSNKELAVQLYSAILQSAATVMSNPNYKEITKIPTLDDAVEQVALLTEKLSSIKDNQDSWLQCNYLWFSRRLLPLRIYCMGGNLFLSFPYLYISFPMIAIT